MGGSVGSGTKTSTGPGVGVTMRATVCSVERQVESSKSAAPANEAVASDRLKRGESYRTRR